MENLFTLNEVIGWSISAFGVGATLGLSIGVILGKFFTKPKIQIQEPKEPYIFKTSCRKPLIDEEDYTCDIRQYMYGDKCARVDCEYLENVNQCHIAKKHKLENTKCDYL